jgi:hypothetical protein
MPDGEIQINVKQTSSGDALDATRRKIEELKKAAASYEEKGMTTAAGSARSEARSLERDLARDARERAQSEREITRQRREQDAVARAGGGAGGFRALATIGQAAAIGQLVEASVVHVLERQGIANRGAAGRARDARAIGLMGSYRGSASAATADVEAGEAEVFDLEQNRPELARQKKQGIVSGALQGALYGGGAGFFAGSAIPGVGNMAGALAGALIGGVSGGTRGYFAGARAEEENESELSRREGRNDAMREKAREQFARGAGLELAAQPARIEGNYKEAISLEQTAAAFARYTQVRTSLPKGPEGDGIARDAAGVSLRLRQIETMRGLGSLASARDGRANIAALSSLGRGLGTDEAVTELRRLVGMAEDSRPRKDFTTPPSNSFAQ